MKGLGNLFFTSGNSLEAISLERESTVSVFSPNMIIAVINQKQSVKKAAGKP